MNPIWLIPISIQYNLFIDIGLKILNTSITRNIQKLHEFGRDFCRVLKSK